MNPIRTEIALSVMALAVACDPRKPPCDEAKLRAIDAAYLADVAKVCLPKYDVPEECPEFAGLKAKHDADLKASCQ